MKLPFGKAEIIGPHEHRLFVLPYRVEGALSGLVPVSQIPGVFYSVSLSPSGQVRLQCHKKPGTIQRSGLCCAGELQP